MPGYASQIAPPFWRHRPTRPGPSSCCLWRSRSRKWILLNDQKVTRAGLAKSECYDGRDDSRRALVYRRCRGIALRSSTEYTPLNRTPYPPGFSARTHVVLRPGIGQIEGEDRAISGRDNRVKSNRSSGFAILGSGSRLGFVW